MNTSNEKEQNVPIEEGTLQKAVECYYRRQSRKENPSGYFYRGRRWTPYEEESCDCCEAIAAPSSRYPFSKLLHCRTSVHIANLYGVDPSELARAIKKFRIENSSTLKTN